MNTFSDHFNNTVGYCKHSSKPGIVIEVSQYHSWLLSCVFIITALISKLVGQQKTAHKKYTWTHTYTEGGGCLFQLFVIATMSLCVIFLGFQCEQTATQQTRAFLEHDSKLKKERPSEMCANAWSVTCVCLWGLQSSFIFQLMTAQF